MSFYSSCFLPFPELFSGLVLVLGDCFIAKEAAPHETDLKKFYFLFRTVYLLVWIEKCVPQIVYGNLCSVPQRLILWS